ncbi:hypothetical protein ABEV34_05030 [Methylorubrum rhodesianum]|uniref:hypothetical protein n=1 Tax=Methylorubrum rhodesianum TaxID=29427 RepID=UPI003D2906FD
MNDIELLHARQVALTGTLMAVLTQVTKADPNAAMRVRQTAHNYVNDKNLADDGRRVALEFIDHTLFSEWESAP